ncbi:MAG: hypothetical protein IJM27_03580 [Eubacterium sp.]|nr:hypothetical protein [Eubacterium sp.]
MMKERKKLVFRAMVCLILMAVVFLIGPEVYAAGSGVTELDNAAEKTNTIVTWVCSWIGGLMALFGIIWAAINQASHNSEGRNQGIIVGAIGIVVAFAPQITKVILGK